MICSLAKQLDMTERQVERWWRLRRSQDKPSTLVKFCENMWRFTFYLYNFSYGLFILWEKEWLWDIDQCYIGYPHQGLTNDIWWYYMISAAFYWSLTFSQFWDVRRKDFWQMFVHHIATILLLSFSWVCNLHRIGTLVLLVHDCADIFLDAAKAAKYANYQRLCDSIFAVFTVLWIISRLVVYPFYIIWSTSIRAPMLLPMFPAYYIFNSLLCLLLGLHMVWTWLILQVAYKAISAGQSKAREIYENSRRDPHSTTTKVLGKGLSPVLTGQCIEKQRHRVGPTVQAICSASVAPSGGHKHDYITPGYEVFYIHVFSYRAVQREGGVGGDKGF
ncbi:hypothetical protein HW555_008038 [Spodoptera exigua]|uniref:TLC domain-containing protein n=1 Tax=Spodoptera exigua TaxID=7107 RepID=A0A835L8A2_SPOEX|nr:hypothetical protein HW555_008038 [Spodoptera exigua]